MLSLLENPSANRLFDVWCFSDFDILPIDAVENNNQLAFDVAQKELKISPIMSGKDMVTCDIPDKLAMVSYLSQFYEVFKQDTLPGKI